MKTLFMEEIAKAVQGEIIYGTHTSKVSNVWTDSRAVNEESLFFPLIGERFNGHDFIKNVIISGCRNIIISQEEKIEKLDKENVNIIKVEDTTKALQELAKYYLEKCNIKVIGVTGSTGKTSTKDMVYAICKEKYKTDCNKGNFNNHIGLPLSVLSFEEDTEIGVLEMGMDKFGEIELLAHIAKPQIGIITNIGLSHIENFNSQSDIFKAKMEIVSNFNKDNTLIISKDEEFLNKDNIKGDYEVVVTGQESDCDIKVSDIVEKGHKGIEFDLSCDGKKQHFNIPVLGRHNAFNGALAVGVAIKLGIPMEVAAKALSKTNLTEKRLTIRECGSLKIIDDTYNASPDSMRAAIDLLKATDGGRKIAILGEMYELGDKTKEYHYQVGEYALSKGVDTVYGVGPLAESICAGAKSEKNYFETKEMFWNVFKENIKTEDVILLKGSRGMKMETLVEKILERGDI